MGISRTYIFNPKYNETLEYLIHIDYIIISLFFSYELFDIIMDSDYHQQLHMLQSSQSITQWVFSE